MAAALAVGYQHEPLVLRAWSPDPAGRWLPLVEHVVDAAMVMNFGLSERLDLGTAFVMVPYQKGLGIDAARSQQSSGLERTALRDPRLGIGYAAFEHSDGDSRYLLRVRTDLTLPLGDTRSFARDRSPVLAPGGSLVSRRGRFEAGLDASFRLKQSVTLGDVRHGSQLVTHLGVALDLWSDERLRASLETSWFWNVAPRTREAREAHLRHLPAEWLLGLVSRLNGRSSLGLYGGAGLPSSARRIDLGERQGPRESFVGLGAPDLRLLLVFVQTSARSEP